MENSQKAVMNVTSFDLQSAVTYSRFFTKVKLKTTTRLVLRTLIDFWNPSKGKVFPRQKTIADCTGASLKTVNTAIDELRVEGLLLTNGEQGEKLNYYFTRKFFELLGFTQGQEKITQEGCVKSPYHGTKKTEQRKNKSFSFSSYDKPKGTQYKTVQETKELLNQIEETKKIDFAPKDFNREEAQKWLKSLPKELHGGILAQEVYQKHGFKMSEEIQQILIQRGKFPKIAV